MPLTERRHAKGNTLPPRVQDRGLDPVLASEALGDGLRYLRDQWGWSGSKVARILHLSPTTVNGWLRRKCVPISGAGLPPDVQAVIHLLAIQRNLASMFEEPFHQLQWLTTEHPDLGDTPLNKMSESIEALIQVRQYLDYVRGRGA